MFQFIISDFGETWHTCFCNRQVFFYKLLAESYLASAGASWIAETEQKLQAVQAV